MLLWLALLKIPVVVMSPRHSNAWGSFDEIAIITTGAWCLFASHAGASGKRTANWQSAALVSVPLIVSLP
jgi:hypothetical protein